MNNKILNSMIWKFMERFGTTFIQFILQIILARLLSPSDYGAIALLNVFILISNVFIQQGFTSALIQRQDVKEADYSSVFIVSFIVAIICYIILFLLAPYIAIFYNLPILKDILRTLSLILFVGSYNSIQIAKISKGFRFKQLFYSSLIGIIISGTISIICAYCGLGIWTLVLQQLLNQIIITIVLYFETKWIPRLYFEFTRIRILFSFGSKLLLSSLLDVTYNNIYNLVIGKVYSSHLLGYYNRADQFPNVIVSNINGSIQSVIFPALSELQNNKIQMKFIVRKAMMMSAYIIFPLMMGLSAIAHPLVILLLTDKWIASVTMLKLICFSYMLWPIHTANLQAISAIGKSKIYLKLELIKKGIGIICLIISIPFGIYIMISMKIVSSFIGIFVNASPNKKLLNYGYKEQVRDLFPTFFISLIMYILIEILNLYIFIFTSNLIIVILTEIAFGIAIYIILSIMTKNKSFYYIKEYIANFSKY